MTIIHIGDGRHIELDEGAAFRPPPPPPKKRDLAYRKKFSPQTKRRSRKTEDTYQLKGDAHHHAIMPKKLIGWSEWWTFKNKIMGKYRDAGAKHGDIPGVRRSRTPYILRHVKDKVKKDMENIEKAHPDLDVMAKEALEGALTVLRGPQSQQMKLAAAKLLLEFTKSKPVAKSEVSVNAAEAWLASLGKEDDA